MTQHKMTWIRVQAEGLDMPCVQDSCQLDTTKICIWEEVVEMTAVPHLSGCHV